MIAAHSLVGEVLRGLRRPARSCLVHHLFFAVLLPTLAAVVIDRTIVPFPGLLPEGNAT